MTINICQHLWLGCLWVIETSVSFAIMDRSMC